MTLPYYYTRLGPFREAFRTGVPILCYHHIAPPRRGARLKWLYVPPKIFARQIAELQSAGFSTPEIHTVQTLSGRFSQDSDTATPLSATLRTKNPGESA